MTTSKKTVELGGTDKESQARLGRVDKDVSMHARGIGGDPLEEPVPRLIKTQSEREIANGNNASIVLGRDRPKSRLSGYGGRGDTQAASIDLVAGRMGFRAKEFTGRGKRVWVDPDFEKDAARIYISQKTDVDENFGLARGQVGNARTKSAVALKADGVRIIGREGIKLITKTDTKNSQGGNVESTVGIDLIAGNNDSDMQPIPKGTNLNESLKRLVHHVDKLNGIVDGLLMAQMTFNTALTHHFHFSPFFGLPTTPSPPVMAAGIKTMIDHLFQTKRSLIMHKVNMSLFKQNYYSPFGGKYINSRYNNVN